MATQTEIRTFEEQQIRTVWDSDEGVYYFSVVDVVQVLTEQPDYQTARNYWKVLKNRLAKNSAEPVTNCNQLKLLATDGKMRLTDVADVENLLDLLQYIPSKKVEKFREWLESFEKIDDADKGEIIVYQPDETIRLEVRMDNETVWLTQQQMSELFGTQRQAITKHLNNIFDSAELERGATSSILELVQTEGERMVRRKVELFNLDVIISVGFRVNTQRGIQFRQWANRVLKEYLMKGYAADRRYFALERKVTEQGKQINELQSKVDFFVRTSLPPVEGVFYDGQIFDAFVQIIGLFKQAKTEIVVIDNYADETVLMMLSKRAANVSATIYTRQNNTDFQLALTRYNAQYPPITVNYCQYVHDRFVITDDVVYHFGASLKDAGKKLFAYIKMQEKPAEILKLIR